MKQSESDWSNEKLERKIRQNPDDACLWNELFTRLKRQLFPRAMRTCNNNMHDAEELVQEVFLVMVEKLSEIESLTAYAHGIMRHKCSQWIEQKQKTEGRFVPPKSDRDDEEEYDFQSEQPGPGDRVVHDEVFNVIKAFFKRNSKHWDIIKSKMFDKLSHADIAVELGISKVASRKRLYEAVTALRELCDKRDITSEQFKGAIKRYYYEMPE